MEDELFGLLALGQAIDESLKRLAGCDGVPELRFNPGIEDVKVTKHA